MLGTAEPNTTVPKLHFYRSQPSTPIGDSMQARQLIAIASTAFALCAFGTAAHAEKPDDFSFSGMWKMDYIDKDKDGMVAKAEFIAVMTKAWEMKAKEMKIKQDKMTAEEFRKFLESFSHG
jgi:hypothetical protein